jgi:hypothetical protein
LSGRYRRRNLELHRATQRLHVHDCAERRFRRGERQVKVQVAPGDPEQRAGSQADCQKQVAIRPAADTVPTRPAQPQPLPCGGAGRDAHLQRARDRPDAALVAIVRKLEPDFNLRPRGGICKADLRIRFATAPADRRGSAATPVPGQARKQLGKIGLVKRQPAGTPAS